ncbi:sensor histidine kinase, partial [Ameyamaea chiangmaiensis]
ATVGRRWPRRPVLSARSTAEPPAARAGFIADSLDLMPDPVILLDRHGTLTYANNGARQLYGETLGAVARHPALQDVAATLRETESACATLALDVPVRRVIRAHMRRLPASGTDAGQTVAVVSDHTAQDALERTRADFVAYASHELRTPLAALTGFIETLRGPAADDPAAQQQFLGVMAAQAARMQRLIDRMLTLSRVQQLEHQRPRGIADAVIIMERAMAEASALVHGTSMTLVMAPPHDDLPIRADGDQMVQVLMNLIENAIKYAGAARPLDGRIDLSVARAPQDGRWPRDDGAILCVADNGPGIDARHLPRLTERFYRVENTATRVSGSGLGLAIVKHILDRHAGRLIVESEPGHGTTFIVWLPLASSQASSEEESVSYGITPDPIAWE